MVKFETKRTLAEISRYKDNAKRLTLTSWNDNPAKLDLRIWTDVDTEPRPGKGVTLSLEEAQILAVILTDYIQEITAE